MYNVIAYKPNSDDYCHGWHMASYSSDMEFICSEHGQEIVEFIAKYMSINEITLGCNESPYCWLVAVAKIRGKNRLFLEY